MQNSINPPSPLTAPVSFRVFVTNVVPGGIVALPLVHLFFLIHEIKICSLIKHYPVSFLLGYFAISSFLGMIIEDLGGLMETIIEKRIFPKDKKSTETSEDHMKKVWEEYLRLDILSKPIGQHYLTTIVTRLKFELNTCCACILFFWIALVNCLFYTKTAYITPMVLALIISFYLCYEAQNSQRLLHKIRENILKGPSETKSKIKYTA